MGQFREVGGADGDRTRYLVVANDALSQMSYSPKRQLSIYLSGVLFKTYPIVQMKLPSPSKHSSSKSSMMLIRQASSHSSSIMLVVKSRNSVST